MKAGMLKDCIESQMMSPTCLQASPLTDRQHRIQCKKCKSALGDHQLPYMYCPYEDKWGEPRFSKKRRFEAYADMRTTQLEKDAWIKTWKESQERIQK